MDTMQGSTPNPAPSGQKSFGWIMNAREARPTRRLVILGISGSVGSTAYQFLEEGGIDLAGFSVHSSVERVREILAKRSVPLVAISSSSHFADHHKELQREFPRTIFLGGEEGVVELVRRSCEEGADTVLTAVVGACGIQATMAALELGMKVALANKETLVTAGPAIEHTLAKMKQEGRENRPVILPVDSEHNAIFQLLDQLKPDHLRRVILTASGGPFFDRSGEELAKVTREEVLDHPTWSMGPKITVDSAGLINKGLEVIEAHHLFSLPYDSLDVLVHRKSLVHGMVGTADGGYLLCASQPHMVFPVAHALHYPDPVPSLHSVATPPQTWPSLQFEEVAPGRFRGFDLCLEAGRKGGTAPAHMNGANEVAVELFLRGGIGFTDIPILIEMVLGELETEYGGELGLYLEADSRARESARRNARRLSV